MYKFEVRSYLKGGSVHPRMAKARSMARSMARCSKCRLELADISVRKCPHPVVNRVFGPDICIYCCSKCKHKVTFEFTGALGCNFKSDE